MKRIILIAAMDEGRVIGVRGTIPWHLPEDLKRFKDLTTGHAVLMGRKTWESLPEKCRPLARRTNLVVTRNPAVLRAVPEDVLVFTSIEKAVEWFRTRGGDILWVIGGEEVYREAISFCDEVNLTLVKGVHDGDAFFPAFEEHFRLEDTENRQGFEYRRYVRLKDGAAQHHAASQRQSR